jgi:hypothetical protein
MEIARLVLDYIEALIWPIFAVVCVFLFRSSIIALFPRLTKAKFPGVSFDFEGAVEAGKLITKEIEAAGPPPEARDRKGVAIPQTGANARMIELGLQPSPSGLELGYYRSLIEQDPNIAMAGLRMELEILGRNLAKTFNVELSNRRDSATTIYRKLQERGAITARQFELVQTIVKLCNAAIHGQRVTREQAESILDMARVLSDQYLSWLSWGFPDR